MADALCSGPRFRTFNVNDNFNRESLRIEIDTSLPSPRVVRALNDLVELRGAPQRLRLDNGPEFISAALRQWAQWTTPPFRGSSLRCRPGRSEARLHVHAA